VPFEIHFVDKADFADVTPVFAVEVLEMVSQMLG
jgi:hypothetical protein